MQQLEMQEETKTTTNLQQIRNLVDKLEAQVPRGTDYSNTMVEIKKVIENEQKIINKLKQPSAKLKHYESICNSIVGILANVSV
jgi:hypothetical protein